MASTNPSATSTSFTDLLKNSVLENFGSTISISQIAVTLGVAFLIGLFIFFLYRKIFSGILYSKSFNVSLIGMTMITAIVILAVNSNLILSLGMVGALSIVRFRTPIKDPTDLIFLFWAAAVGIVTGAGFYSLAMIGSAIVGLILFFFVKGGSKDTPYLLVVNCVDDQTEEQLHKYMSASIKRYNVKQKNITASNIELTLEIRLRDKSGQFINQLTQQPGIRNAMLISYNGDYVS